MMIQSTGLRVIYKICSLALISVIVGTYSITVHAASDIQYTQSPFVVTNNLGTDPPKYELDITLKNVSTQNITSGEFYAILLPYFDLDVTNLTDITLCDGVTQLSSVAPNVTGTLADGLMYTWSGSYLSMNVTQDICVTLPMVLQSFNGFDPIDFEIFENDTSATPNPCQNLATYYNKYSFRDMSSSPLNGGNEIIAGLEHDICIKYNTLPPYPTAYEDSIGIQNIGGLSFNSGNGPVIIPSYSQGFSSIPIRFAPGDPIAMCDVNDDTCNPQYFVDGTDNFDPLTIYNKEGPIKTWYNIDGKVRVAWRILDAPATIQYFKLSWNEGTGIAPIQGTEVSSNPNGQASTPEYTFQGTDTTSGESTYYTEFSPNMSINGMYIFKIQACDYFANCSVLLTKILYIDNIMPNIEIDKNNTVSTARNAKEWIKNLVTHSTVYDDFPSSGPNRYSELYLDNNKPSVDLLYSYQSLNNPEKYKNLLQTNAYPTDIVDPNTLSLNTIDDNDAVDTNSTAGVIQYEKLLDQDGIYYLLASVRDNADQSFQDASENYNMESVTGVPTLTSSTRKFISMIAVDRTAPNISNDNISFNTSNLSNFGACDTNWYHLDVSNPSDPNNVVLEIIAEDVTSGIERGSDTTGLTYSQNSGSSQNWDNISYLGPALPTQWKGDITIDTEGKNALTIKAVDDAGNESVNNLEVNIDTHTPEMKTFTLTSSSTDPSDLTLIQSYLDDTSKEMAVAGTDDGTDITYFRQTKIHNADPTQLFFEFKVEDIDPKSGSGTEGIDFSGNGSGNGTAFFRYMLQDTFDGTNPIKPEAATTPYNCFNNTSNMTDPLNNCWSEWLDANTGTYTVDYNDGYVNGYDCVDASGNSYAGDCYHPELVDGHHYVLWIEVKDCAGNISDILKAGRYSHGIGLGNIHYKTEDSPTPSPISFNNTNDKKDDLNTNSLTTLFALPVVAGQNVSFSNLYMQSGYDINDLVNSDDSIFTKDTNNNGIPDNRVFLIDGVGNQLDDTYIEVVQVANGGYGIGSTSFQADFDEDIDISALNFSEINDVGSGQVNLTSLPHIRRVLVLQRNLDGSVSKNTINDNPYSSTTFDTPSISTRNTTYTEQLINFNFSLSPNITDAISNYSSGIWPTWEIRENTTYSSMEGSDFFNLGLRTENLFVNGSGNLSQAGTSPNYILNTSIAGIYEVYLAIREAGADDLQYMKIIFEVLPSKPSKQNSHINLIP